MTCLIAPATDLQKLLAEATKGPWRPHWFYSDDGVCYKLSEDTDTSRTEPDCRLIAMAPDLAARVLELEAENARLREIIRVAKANIFNVQIGLESGTTKHAANEQLAKVRATLGAFEHD